ncbi:MAG: hypothetical protein SCALA702_26980 [Melioribacteraceae bacterium]|nr:MAG: hypothetical protein SCALA702_26980 [Melioribacteraceae bacterium]
MRRFVICLIMMLVTTGSYISAQSDVDLNKMVKSQIEEAQLKAKKDQAKKQRLEDHQAAQDGISSGVISIYTFLTLSILIIGGVAVRRFWLKQENTKKRIVKQGILMMRQERIITLDNPKKSFIRQKLGRSQYSAFANGQDITRLARMLDVSQGEVLLAKKINKPQYFPYRTTMGEAKDSAQSSIKRLVKPENDVFGKHVKEYLLKKQNIDTDKLIYLN